MGIAIVVCITLIIIVGIIVGGVCLFNAIDRDKAPWWFVPRNKE